MAVDRLLGNADMTQSKEDDVERFGEMLKLDVKCQEFADELYGPLQKQVSSSTNVVGFHIRHVLDPRAPTVRISCGEGDREQAQKILEENNAASLQTLNHVIDTLYYDTRGPRNPPERRSPKIERLIVWIDYLEDPDQQEQRGIGCHKFDRKSDSSVTHSGDKIPIGERKNYWRYAHYLVCKGAFSDHDIRDVAQFASDRGEARADKAATDLASGSHNTLFTDYTCGSEKFCNDLAITHSLSGYRVITAAVYQLGRYACETNVKEQQSRFGKNTFTALIRSESAFGVVLGATVILDINGKENLRNDIQNKVVDFLERKWEEYVDTRFHFPKATLFSHLTEQANWGTIENAVWGRAWRLTISPEHQLAKRLRDKILGGEPPRTDAGYKERCVYRSTGSLESKWRSWSQLTICPVHAFLQVLRSYAGERLEGQFLTFGFVLGNPQLLTHTPRERPFPITRSPTDQGRRLFFTRDQLIKQVHLVAGPEERAVVIPYTRCDGSGPEGKIAAYLLEFDEAMEEFRAKDWAVLWRDVFVPYLYYTERFPWAVAGFVGPGAAVRVFVDRTIAAYHDEKGWWDIRVQEVICGISEEVGGQIGLLKGDRAKDGTQPDEQRTEGKKNEKESQSELDGIFQTVESILSVALQMSRFANPEAKGGMIVWLAGKGSLSWNPCSPYPELQPSERTELDPQIKSLVALTENLNTSEPLRDPHGNRPWLRGQALTDDKGRLNYATAKLILQAAKQDGAVVVKQKQEVDGAPNSASNGEAQHERHNVVVAFGQRLVSPDPTALASEQLGGTRRASARALMARNNRVPQGSFVVAISSDGPLTIWVKREGAEPAEFKIGAYQEL